MTRIGMGLVGAGFIGPHHVDAVRRLGFVDIVAVAGSSDASGRQKAEALGDIGSHWCDMAQHLTGLRIIEVLGDITTCLPKRKKPRASREAFAAAGNEDADIVDITVEDQRALLSRQSALS